MQRSFHLSSLIVGAGLLAATGLAQAASFQVEPVKLTLNATATTGMLAVRNQGDEPVRVQVTIFRWAQTGDGEVDLQPTKDLVFFPSLITIAPRESRNIRISPAPGANLVNGSAERTYRIIVEELLPPLKSTLPPVALRVLTRMSIRVFVEPAARKPVPKVEGLAVQGKDATFVVRNTGSAHFMTKAVRLFVAAPDGKKLFETSVRGWYVLAGGSRAYTVPLPPAACSSGAAVTVELETDKETVKERLNATCTR